jgi:CBS domain-containing membrane protein
MQDHRTRALWLIRALGPASARAPIREVARAGLGAAIGLGLVGLFVLAPTIDLVTGLFLIAPFGASAVLVFAVPNSPLAQPWPVIVGNTLAALVGVAACLVIPDAALRIAFAVGTAIALTGLARAVHPPAGAVAMTAAMSPEMVQELGFRFALMPVALGSLGLVVLAMLYARATGRHYPFRQFAETHDFGTSDAPPAERLGLSEAELSALLQRYRQSLNLGVEDLARLIGAAELQAASHRTGPLTAAEIMSRDLVTVGPDTPLTEVAELFRRHGFTSLPVVQEGDKFLGMIFQIHLIRRGREDALRLDRSFGAAMARLLDPARALPVRASDIMVAATARAVPATPAGALIPMLAERGCEAVPVLERGRIRGVVTRTDLIAALARQSLAPTLSASG